MSALDRLAEIEARDLTVCGSCDGGLPMACTCGDPRASLSLTVAALRAVLAVCDVDAWTARDGISEWTVVDASDVIAAIATALDVTP